MHSDASFVVRHRFAVLIAFLILTVLLGLELRNLNVIVNADAVTPGNTQNLATPRAKDIAGNAEGWLVSRLLDYVPASVAESQAIKGRLAANPAYKNMLASKDGRTAAIYVEFKKDPKGFEHVMYKLNAAINPVRDNSVSIEVAGRWCSLSQRCCFAHRNWLG